MPPAFGPIAYRARNRIERAFCRLKDWRAIATRYDKKVRAFLAGVSLLSLSRIGSDESTP